MMTRGELEYLEILLESAASEANDLFSYADTLAETLEGEAKSGSEVARLAKKARKIADLVESLEDDLDVKAGAIDERLNR